MRRFFLFFAISLLFTANIAFAAPVGKVTYVEGKVDVLKLGQTVAIPVSKGDSVDVGDIYRAKSNSKAEIVFINKNVLRIVQNTRTEIKEYSVEGNRSTGIIRLYRGKVQVTGAPEFTKKVAAFAEGNKLEVHTPNAVAGVRGTSFGVSYEGGITWIFCLEGKVYAFNWANPAVLILIPAGGASNVSGDTPPTQPMGLGKGYFETIVMPWVTKNLEKVTEIWQQGTGPGAGPDTTPPVLTLTFFSEVDASLWYHDSISWYNDGYIYGFMGGVTSLWTATQANPAPTTIIGEYYPDNIRPHIWNTTIYSYNYDSGTYTTYDGGAYKGFFAGINELMEGRLVALYIDPSGNAGYLRGSFTGASYPEIDMFLMSGSIYPTQMATNIGISPDSLSDSIWWNDNSDYQKKLSGTFFEGGTILSTDVNSWNWTTSIVNYDNLTAQTWGIYTQSFGGTYDTPTTTWSAKLGGEAFFGAYYYLKKA